MPEPPSVEDPVAACRWWATRGTPAEHALSPREKQELNIATGARIVAAIKANPRAWWAALREVIPTLASPEADMFAGLLRAIIACEPETETDARLLAAESPVVLSVLFYAYREGVSSHESAASALARVPRLPAVEAFVRMNGPNPDGADVWTVGLIRDFTDVNPDFAWELLLDIVAATPEADLIGLGAGHLEHFCKQAAPAFIERIEEAAAQDTKFRTALGGVWPGGSRIPEPSYARIRSAAGRAPLAPQRRLMPGRARTLQRLPTVRDSSARRAPRECHGAAVIGGVLERPVTAGCCMC
jgi:hypothetical protein